MLKPDNTYKVKLASLIKNRADVSEYLIGYDISGLDLTGALITKLNMPDADLIGTSFVRATIGAIDDIGSVNFNRTRFTDCSFRNTCFPGNTWARRADFLRCDFTGAYCPYIDYKYARFNACTFCDTVFSIGTSKSLGAEFDEQFFSDLADLWNIVILDRTKYELLLQNQVNKQQVRE